MTSEELYASLSKQKFSFDPKHVDAFYDELALKPGAKVYDPFAGTGIVGIVGAIRGFATTNVEIDPYNYRLMLNNYQLLRSANTQFLEPVNILGNNLSPEYPNSHFDAVITSPPFTFAENGQPFQSLDEYNGYYSYLKELFRKIYGSLKPEAQMVVVIGNDRFEGKTVNIVATFRAIMGDIGYNETKIFQKPNSAHGTHYIYYTKS